MSRHDVVTVAQIVLTSVLVGAALASGAPLTKLFTEVVARWLAMK